MPSRGNAPPARRDARRNRERLLECARRAFADQGAEAALDGIAREAGLVVGTLYRHFPTRLDLLCAVLEPKLRHVITEVEAALGLEDPWEAFRGLLEVLGAAQAGDRAFGDFLARRFPGDDRTEAVHGEGYVDPALMPAFLPGKGEDMLTTREREILQLLADGMSNADVAAKLFISLETVMSLVRHILTKLEAVTRTHAVAIALREAIID